MLVNIMAARTLVPIVIQITGLHYIHKRHLTIALICGPFQTVTPKLKQTIVQDVFACWRIIRIRIFPLLERRCPESRLNTGGVTKEKNDTEMPGGPGYFVHNKIEGFLTSKQHEEREFLTVTVDVAEHYNTY